jgi:hypothetical protein
MERLERAAIGVEDTRAATAAHARRIAKAIRLSTCRCGRQATTLRGAEYLCAVCRPSPEAA